jgi:hypothetical protein
MLYFEQLNIYYGVKIELNFKKMFERLQRK